MAGSIQVINIILLYITSGALGSYKSRLHVDYQIGAEVPSNPDYRAGSRSNVDQVDDTSANVADESPITWSNSASSDLLF